MRSSRCDVCGQTLYVENVENVENSVCVGCGSAVGHSRSDRDLRALGEKLTPCVDLDLSGCTWIPVVGAGDLYPFVLAPAVFDKPERVSDLVVARASRTSGVAVA
jgi:hypothetical protein